MKKSAKKILITGGAGFIGTHLSRQLRAWAPDAKIAVLDLRKPTQPVAGVTYTQGDIRDPQALNPLLSGCDAVFHFAAHVSVPFCQENPVESYQNNLVGTAQVLESIRRVTQGESSPQPRVIFASSSAVYGDPGSLRAGISEESETLGKKQPLSFYGDQKLGSEDILRLFHVTDKIPVLSFRFFNVYGPGQDPSSPYSGVISLFSKAISEGKGLALHNGGKQSRDFVSVHDVARACVLTLEAPVEVFNGQAINLGGGAVMTIRELAEKMMKVAGRRVDVADGPARSGDIFYSHADISRAAQVLGWKPGVSLDQGLAELLVLGQ